MWPSQGREPAETHLYAEYDRGPNRVGPVILRVPAPPPTANLQINLQWDCVCGDEGTLKRGRASLYVCVYVCIWCVWMCESSGGRTQGCLLLHLQLWSTISEEKLNYVTDSESNKETILMLIWHFFNPAGALRWKKKEKKSKKSKMMMVIYVCLIIEWFSVYSQNNAV